MQISMQLIYSQNISLMSSLANRFQMTFIECTSSNHITLFKSFKISIKIDPSQRVKSETLIVEIIGQWSLLISLQSGRMKSGGK